MHEENQILVEEDFKKITEIGTKFDNYLAFVYKIMKKLSGKSQQFKDLVLSLDYNDYFSNN